MLLSRDQHAACSRKMVIDKREISIDNIDGMNPRIKV